MSIEFNAWKKDVIEFGKREGVETKLKKHPSAGTDVEFYTATITFRFKENDLIITQGATKYDYCYCTLSNLQFEYKAKTLEKFYLYIYRQDFLSRIFSRNKIKVDNELFDKTFNIKSSHSSIALKLFKKDNVQRLFLSFPYLIFNIRTEDNLMHIVLKDARNKQYINKEMQELLAVFKWIIDIVLT